jgi:DNA-binding MarR family transcriptional regulator
MRAAKARDVTTMAARAWRRLFEVFMSTRWQRDQVLERFGLTPNDAKALGTLDPDDGKPMRALAELWGTDASNATWVVDRLERLGLAERRTVAGDRRVKLVGLTSRGVRIRDDIMRAFHAPPAELLTLELEDLRTLEAILGRVSVQANAWQRSSLDGSPTRTRRGPKQSAKTRK